MHLFPAQIEETVLQADILGIPRILIDRHWQWIRHRLHVHSLDTKFDFTCRQGRVDRLGATPQDLARRGNDGFDRQSLDLLEQRIAGIHDKLRDTVIVPKVDEQQIAVIPFPGRSSRTAVLTDLHYRRAMRHKDAFCMYAFFDAAGLKIRRAKGTDCGELSRHSGRNPTEFAQPLSIRTDPVYPCSPWKSYQ